MVPMYYSSKAEASKNGDMNAWASSYAENVRCVIEIDKEIALRNGDVPHNLAYNLLSKYGYDRLIWVFSATIRSCCDDYPEDLRSWASSCCTVPFQDLYGQCLSSEPSSVLQLIRSFRMIYDALGMYETSSCVPGSKPMGRNQSHAGKIYVVSAQWLSNDYKRPQFQIFRATGRTGPSNTLVGNFLYDGDFCSVSFQDILGELKPELYPSWLIEKLGALNF